MFAWNLQSLTTGFERHSLALNTIERGRAWHWRLLPAGWADSEFIFRHGQIKTKRAFARFFCGLHRGEIQIAKKRMKAKRRAAPPKGENPLEWNTVKAVFAKNPSLKKAGVLAGAQALLNEHLANEFGRFSFDIDLHTAKDLEAVRASLLPEDRKRIRLVSRANPEMFLYEVQTDLGPVKVEIANPYMAPRHRPVMSKHIPGLKVVHFADLIDAKISALSTRGFPRDFVDLYAAHRQKGLSWRRILARASTNPWNDYNPIELENNLRLLDQDLQKGAHDIPCTHPPPISDLRAFLNELREVNAAVARELSGVENGPEYFEGD